MSKRKADEDESVELGTDPMDTEGRLQPDPDPAAPSFEERHPIGAGDLFDRVHALEVHLKALLTGHSHEELHQMGIKRAPPDIGGDTVDSSPMED